MTDLKPGTTMARIADLEHQAAALQNQIVILGAAVEQLQEVTQELLARARQAAGEVSAVDGGDG